MQHEHRYTGFKELGKAVRRCQSCFALEPDQSESPTPVTAPEPEPVQAGDDVANDESQEGSDEMTSRFSRKNRAADDEARRS